MMGERRRGRGGAEEEDIYIEREQEMKAHELVSLEQDFSTLCLLTLSTRKFFFLGFPGGAVVKNPPASAGDMGSSPGRGGSHVPQRNWAPVPQLLSLPSGAREPQLLSPRVTTTETRAPRACALQQEKPPQ